MLANTNDKMLLTPDDVYRIVGFGRNTINRLFNSSDFPSFKVGRRHYITRENLLKWMEQQASDKKC